MTVYRKTVHKMIRWQNDCKLYICKWKDYTQNDLINGQKNEMIVEEMTVEEMTGDKMTGDKMPADKITANYTTLNERSIHKMTWLTDR